MNQESDRPSDGFKPPSEPAPGKSSSRHALSNADFRKLLETPRRSGQSGAAKDGDATPASGSTEKSKPHAFTHRSAHVDIGGGTADNDDGKGSSKKKKRSFHGKKQDDDEDSLNAILKKYRDRAKERRDDGVIQPPEMDVLQATASYKAVAPDLKTTLNTKERRKQMIQESKYLGGDMEHTHLVKGLDYALLQKVRSEIASKQREDDTELEDAYERRDEKKDDIEFKTRMGHSIYRTLFRSNQPLVNELFGPRRMAYVVSLEDEGEGDSDIPTTLIRSKADCPIIESTSAMSQNDMVIQKLTQVLSYLRTDNRKKKRDKGKDKEPLTKGENKRTKDTSIYDDIGEYVPSASKTASVPKKPDTGTYFDAPAERPEKHGRDRDSGVDRKDRDRKDKTETDSRLAAGFSPADLAMQAAASGSQPEALGTGKQPAGKRGQPAADESEEHDPLSTKGQRDGIYMDIHASADNYAECYPGGGEFYAAGDSDDEADFTKMDSGTKKGLIRRWDFETTEDYEHYMSKREALPKAAFQYGVKMNDGRKTRGKNMRGENQEKQKLDREWQKISKLISKRKETGESGIPAKRVRS